MPPPEVGLLTIEEPAPAQGESLALGSDPDGGRSLILTNGEPCGECCGVCAVVARWVACGVSAEDAPCAVDPDVVWLCVGAGCGGENRVKWRNRCYRPADPAVTKPVQDLTSEEILLSSTGPVEFRYTCLPSCEHPDCTECELFLRCVPCADSRAGGPPENVFIPSRLVTCCGIAGGAANAQGQAFCFTAEPGGQTLTAANLPAGAIILDGPVRCGTDCCDCTYVTCGGRATGSFTSCATGQLEPYSCCCPRSFTLGVRYQFRQVIRTPGQQATEYVTLEATGEYSIEFVEGNQVGPTPTIHHVQTTVGSGVTSVTEFDAPGPRWQCGQEAGWSSIASYLRYVFFCPDELRQNCGGTFNLNECDNYDGAGSRLVIDNAFLKSRCNGSVVTGQWTEYDGPQYGSLLPRSETRVFITFTITAHDPCGSNCGGTVGIGVLAARARRGLKGPVVIVSEKPVSEGMMPDGTAAALHFMRGGG